MEFWISTLNSSWLLDWFLKTLKFLSLHPPPNKAREAQACLSEGILRGRVAKENELSNSGLQGRGVLRRSEIVRGEPQAQLGPNTMTISATRKEMESIFYPITTENAMNPNLDIATSKKSLSFKPTWESLPSIRRVSINSPFKPNKVCLMPCQICHVQL